MLRKSSHARVKPVSKPKKSMGMSVNDQLRTRMGGGATAAILSCLEVKDIKAVISSCKTLKEFGDSNRAWSTVLTSHFGESLTKSHSKMQYRAHVLLKKASEAKWDEQYQRYQKLKDFLLQCHPPVTPTSQINPAFSWIFYFYMRYYLNADPWQVSGFGLRALEEGDLRAEKPLFEFFLYCPLLVVGFTPSDIERFCTLLERENSTINSKHTQTAMKCVLASHLHYSGDALALKRKVLEDFFESLYSMDTPADIIESLCDIISALKLESDLFALKEMKKNSIVEFQEEEPSHTLEIIMHEKIYPLIKKDKVLHALLLEHIKKLISNKVGIAAFYYATHVILIDNLFKVDQDPAPDLARKADLLFEAKPYLLLALQYGEFQALGLLHIAQDNFPDFMSYEKLVEIAHEALNNFPDSVNCEKFIEILKEPAKEGVLPALYYLFVTNEIPWQSSPSLTWILLSNILNENLLGKTIELEFENELPKIEKGSMWVRCALTILYALRGEAEKAKYQYQFSAPHMQEFLSVGREEDCCTQEIEEAVEELEQQQKAMETPLRRSLRKR